LSAEKQKCQESTSVENIDAVCRPTPTKQPAGSQSGTDLERPAYTGLKKTDSTAGLEAVTRLRIHDWAAKELNPALRD